MSAEMTSSRKWDKNHFPIREIKVACENDLLYDKFGTANADDRSLAFPVGVLESLRRRQFPGRLSS